MADFKKKQKEIIIQSDKQSEIKNVIFAEGNVSVSYRGKILNADNLIYDKFNKKITAKGNVELILGDQTFKVSYLEYSFLSKKGYLLNVLGSINTNTLRDIISSWVCKSIWSIFTEVFLKSNIFLTMCTPLVLKSG